MVIQQKPSLLVFGSQFTRPSKQYLAHLRALLLIDPRLSPLLAAIEELSALRQKLAKFDERLEEVLGRGETDPIQQWIKGEDLRLTSDRSSNVLITPLTVLVHMVQYLQYLKSNEATTTHQNLMTNVQIGGAQGCGAGILSAIAVACSESEKDVVKFATTILRLAMCIGAFVDLDGLSADSQAEWKCLAVRWTSEAGGAVLRKILSVYDETYISVILDSRNAIVTCPKCDLERLIEELAHTGLIVEMINSTGRFHSPVLADSAEKIHQFCNLNEGMQLPLASDLRIPVRSTSDGRIFCDGALLGSALTSILTESADWHLTVTSACLGITPLQGSQSVICFGTADPISPAVARELRLSTINVGEWDLLSSSSTVRNPILASPAPLASISTVPNKTVHDTLLPYASKRQQYPDHAIAIVGMGCKFPGANSIEEFWQLLKSGKSMTQDVPADRFPTSGPRSPAEQRFFGNWIHDADAFDHRFFKKSSREAASMDPQQRLLLEVSYQALESAGYFAEWHENSRDIGCYIGVCASDYNDNVASHKPNAFSTLGTLRAFLSGKISHFFGWIGPSVTFDTACSSSAVAIDAACRAIQQGQCSMAIAGGVTVFTSPHFFQNLMASDFLSPTGGTKPFDAGADGYCRGEGVGLVFLKKLSCAVADQDNVLGVISATAVSQSSNEVSITVPHSQSQVNLYDKVLRLANVRNTDVSVVEAHGTGTPIGDLSEFEGIKKMFGGQDRTQPLFLGSVKGNIGHTEGASGVAGLIKVVLMMQHKAIPPQANFNKLSPKMSLMGLGKMLIPTKMYEWHSEFMVACINNYGAAGSIAAIVICQAPVMQSIARFRHTNSPKYPIVLSANSRKSLVAYCDVLGAYLADIPAASRSESLLADIAFNLNEKQNWSLTEVFTSTVSSLNELESQLSDVKSASAMSPLQTTAKAKAVILAFGGQTDNFTGLSLEVYNTSALFRYHLDQCDFLIRSLGFEGIYPRIFEGKAQNNIVALHSMQFAIQYSCAKTWLESGLTVDGVVGHSFGQLTALTFSGSLSLVEGLRLVCGRAKLIQTHWGPERGAMIAVNLDLNNVQMLISSLRTCNSADELEIACFNGPKSHVLVGSKSAIEAVERTLVHSPSFLNVQFQRLSTTHGFHSKYTEPLLPELLQLAETINIRKTKLILETCSNDSSWDSVSPKLLTEHTRNPVFFGQAIERLCRRFGPSTWLEAGNNSSVINMARRALSADSPSHHSFFPIDLRSPGAMNRLAETTISLRKSGHKIQFWPLHRCQRLEYAQINLPPYQFEKTKHWLHWIGPSQPLPETLGVKKDEREPLLLSFTGYRDATKRVADFVIDQRSEQYRLLVQGHAVLGNPLCPVSLYIELVAQAAHTLHGTSSTTTFTPCFEDVTVKLPLGCNQYLDIALSLTLTDGPSPRWGFEFHSRTRQSHLHDTSVPQQHATGTVVLIAEHDRSLTTEIERFRRLIKYYRFENLIMSPEAEAMRGALIYKVFAEVVQYADYYKGVKTVSSKDQEVAGRVTLSGSQIFGTKNSSTNPIALDNFIQVAGIYINSLRSRANGELYVCTKIERVQLDTNFTRMTESGGSWSVFSCFSHLDEVKNDVASDVFIFDSEKKNLVAIFFGVEFTKVQQRSLVRILARSNNSEDRPQTQAMLPSETVGGNVSPQNSLTTSRNPTGDQFSKLNDSKVDHEQSTSVLVVKSLKISENTIDGDLRSILTNLTDVPSAEIYDHSPLEELGIDSLMTTEITTEIRQILGVNIPRNDWLGLVDFQSLSIYVQREKSQDGSSSSGTLNELHSQGEAVNMVFQPLAHDQQSFRVNHESNTRIESQVADLLASHLDVTPNTFTRNTCLADHGLDSFLSMKLALDIQRLFSIQIDVLQLTAKLRFGELLNLVFGAVSSESTSLLFSSSSLDNSVGITPAPNNSSGSENNTTWLGGIYKMQTNMGLTNAVGSQCAFEKIRYDFENFAKETRFAGFWKQVYPMQMQLVVAYIVEAFAHCGCSLALLKTGEPVPQLPAITKHQRLVHIIYKALQHASIINLRGHEWTRSEVELDATPSISFHEMMNQKFPQHHFELELLKLTGSILSELLIDVADPIQVLFGTKSNRDLLEEVYTNGPMYLATTRLLGKFLASAFTDSSALERIHILEIGGGTGGTTNHIIDTLLRQRINFTYTFTDISQSLVAAAKRKFSKYECMEFRVLDIESKPPLEFASRFHTIISTNCIHATRNLTESLTHVRHMLRADGFVSVVEFTKNILWFDLVFGLLEGWWRFNDGRNHVIADEAFWVQSMNDAGFKHVAMTDGPSLEAKTLRIISGWASEAMNPHLEAQSNGSHSAIQKETFAYKYTSDNVLHADIFYPKENETGQSKRPIALMIHGGGHVMLSRQDCSLKQTRLLLEEGFLPVAIDYRLCPETTLLEGPMTDVCDALDWARNSLPALKLKCKGLQVDGDRVVAVGWSTGGTLAMTLAWTPRLWKKELAPPQAILAFYCPTDYEDDFWKKSNFPSNTTSLSISSSELLQAVAAKPMTAYNIPPSKQAAHGWLAPTDSRSRLILHMNHHAQHLPILFSGLPTSLSCHPDVDYTSLPQPPPASIKKISPFAQLQDGTYRTPTFLVHGTQDDLVPWAQSRKFYDGLLECGVRAGLELIEGGEHLFDLWRHQKGEEREEWKSVRKGYKFLRECVRA